MKTRRKIIESRCHVAIELLSLTLIDSFRIRVLCIFIIII